MTVRHLDLRRLDARAVAVAEDFLADPALRAPDRQELAALTRTYRARIDSSPRRAALSG